ncbi:MAG: hypothetical protein HY306_00435 [Nitrosomonadales bacterium]|nr:hypothetical protein [Nitrosomonadales bacterium]
MRKEFPIAVILVVAVWAISIPILRANFDGPKNVNEFGDMFGAVNALFSGVALAALITTLWLQHQESVKQAESQKGQAILLKETARIHALSALLASYTQRISLAQGTLSGQEFSRVDDICQELERHVAETL